MVLEAVLWPVSYSLDRRASLSLCFFFYELHQFVLLSSLLWKQSALKRIIRHRRFNFPLFVWHCDFTISYPPMAVCGDWGGGVWHCSAGRGQTGIPLPTRPTSLQKVSPSYCFHAPCPLFFFSIFCVSGLEPVAAGVHDRTPAAAASTAFLFFNLFFSPLFALRLFLRSR